LGRVHRHGERDIKHCSAESLGTITQTLGTVITTATAVVSQVSGVGVSTIGTLSNVLTTTLDTTTNVIVGDGTPGNGGILGSFKDVLQDLSVEIVGKMHKESHLQRKEYLQSSINPSSTSTTPSSG
jgi:hypothetical protein